jgi:hypothetical protein
MLGFRGLYGDGSANVDSERVQLAVRRFNLPPSFATWSDGVAHVIKQRRIHRNSAIDVEAPERTVMTAQPLWGRAQLLWPWLFATLLAGLLIVRQYY